MYAGSAAATNPYDRAGQPVTDGPRLLIRDGSRGAWHAPGRLPAGALRAALAAAGAGARPFARGQLWRRTGARRVLRRIPHPGPPVCHRGVAVVAVRTAPRTLQTGGGGRRPHGGLHRADARDVFCGDGGYRGRAVCFCTRPGVAADAGHQQSGACSADAYPAVAADTAGCQQYPRVAYPAAAPLFALLGLAAPVQRGDYHRHHRAVSALWRCGISVGRGARRFVARRAPGAVLYARARASVRPDAPGRGMAKNPRGARAVAAAHGGVGGRTIVAVGADLYGIVFGGGLYCSLYLCL